MYSSILSASIYGMTARKIRVEADVSNGLPGTIMVGYLAGQVHETMERVRTAVKNSGFHLEPKKITVNLAPAGFKKEGTFYDLPVALAILAAYGILNAENFRNLMVIGELGLNGEVCPVSGVLPVVLAAKKEGCLACMVPKKNQKEAECCGSLPIIGVDNLREAVKYILETVENREADGISMGTRLPMWRTVPIHPGRPLENIYTSTLDFQDIRGQSEAIRGAEIAVSGFHNLLLIGPPGSGKSMLASRIPTILPPLTEEEALEISSIYSIAGLLDEEHPLLSERPFRSPHHTISPQALAGGGKNPRPGEISLAHRGVLFLDELPEFGRSSLEVLRQPLEDRKILISRSSGSVRFPADFLFIAAMNPCKCGYYPDMTRCTCTERELHGYLYKISQPLLDRMDLKAEMSRVSVEALLSREHNKGESSLVIRKRVEAVHQIQRERYQGTAYRFNGDLDTAGIRRYCELGEGEERFMEKLYQKFDLTARGYCRILKVARTIADMDHSDQIKERHLTEAVFFRAVDQKYWR